MSHDGISALSIYGTAGTATVHSAGAVTAAIAAAVHGGLQGFVSQQCGTKFGEFGVGPAGQASGSATGSCLVCKCPPNHIIYISD